MTHQKMRKKIPLEVTEAVEYEPGTGVRVDIKRLRRGALTSESRRYTKLGRWVDELCKPTRVIFEKMAEGIRDRLEADGIPTDRHPKWAQRSDGEWVEYRNEGDVNRFAARAIWYARAKKLTDDLTMERAAVEHLWSLIQLLNRDGIDEHLWHVNSLMHTFASLKLTAINDAASAGIAARKARAIGPKMKKQRTAETREVIWQHAGAYWSTHPSLRQDASNTASCIAREVNNELYRRRLLPNGRTALQPKTIADHLRATMRG